MELSSIDHSRFNAIVVVVDILRFFSTWIRPTLHITFILQFYCNYLVCHQLYFFGHQQISWSLNITSGLQTVRLQLLADKVSRGELMREHDTTVTA